ncbi:ankyrin repeat domain-containing protein [Nostoc sp. FACHB-87]|uniref:ankyrin repeat domain-containing protein n=1 Tax=Nostocaceae TaxID=1162 RepID=UPI0016853A2C|nr:MULTISPECIES: ankyrin repeat domain-containing protein [Nostocaceae]MBD2456152.1 ankyrin repeat domain-containing protein [Nostoc sp. FACHB-87]MBD2473903.1 ankyrin repeat domain-containing protein [Anabaena sp. FACHB-83]
MQQNKNNSRELYDAVVKGDIDTINSLTAKTFHLNHWAFQEWDESLCKFLCPLEKAIEIGNQELIEILLQSPNDDRNSKKEFILRAIIFTTFLNQPKMLQLLIHHLGGKVDDEYILLSGLHHACEEGEAEIVRMFLELGANVDGLWERGTPLMIAAQVGNLDVIKVLIEFGANIDKIATHYDLDDSAIRIAVMNEHWEIVEYMIPFVQNLTDKRFAKRQLAKIKGKAKG